MTKKLVHPYFCDLCALCGNKKTRFPRGNNPSSFHISNGSFNDQHWIGHQLIPR